MTFKEKAGHIVMYYRYHILIGIAVIAILAWALNHYIINPPKKSSLTLLFHTSVMDSDTVSYTHLKDIQPGRSNAPFLQSLG